MPMMRQQMTHIEDLLSEEWWQDVTLPMLEATRRRLRNLVQFIEKRKPVVTDFEDMMGEEVEVELAAFSAGDTFERFRDKGRAFLREHYELESVRKLRSNEPMTTGDLDELEQVLSDPMLGGPEYVNQAKTEYEGLGSL